MTSYTAAMDNAPWYRHRWPWLLMLGPAVVVVAGIVTVWLAVKSDDGLVADDYYKRGLAINERIERGARAGELGLAAVVDVAPDGYVRVRLETASTEAAARPPAVRLVAAHPTRAADDVRATLVRTPDGSYAGRIAPLERGRWNVFVEGDDWRLPAATLEGPGQLRLAAPSRP